VTVCDRGGSNLVEKSVTYFLNGPFQSISLVIMMQSVWHQ